MKTISLFAALVAITTAASVHAETLPKFHAAGGPVKQDRRCWVATDGLGHGWWDSCDKSLPTRPASLRDRQDADAAATAGGGGGGGSGGGGNR
jgi:hypothetical protein